MSSLTLASLRGKSQQEQLAIAAQFVGVQPSVLDGIWRTESQRGDPNYMRSPAGARGHFGLMPNTINTWSQRLGFQVDPDNFEHAVIAGAYTLKENLGKFKNLPDALRAYNGGWDPNRWGNKETQAYVGKVLGSGASPAPVTRSTPVDLSSIDLLNTRPADLRADADSRDEAARNARRSNQYQTTLEKRRDFLNAIGGAAILSTPTQEQGSAGVNEIAAREQAGVARQEARSELSGWDKFNAALQDNTLVAGIVRSLDREHYNYDPNFKYSEQMETLEEGLDYDERQWMRRSRSHAEAINTLGEIEERRKRRDVYQGDGGLQGMAWGLAAGVADPAGWLLGAGLGKSLQVAGVGGRALVAAGRPIAGAASVVAENAAANVLTTATLDALGDYASPEEYYASAAFGGLIGVASTPFVLRGGLADQAAVRQYNEQISVLQRQREERALAAQEIAGPNATPEEIQAVMRQQDADLYLKEAQVALAPFADESRFFNADGSLTVETGEAGLKDKIMEAFGLGTMADNGERALSAELYAKAEQFSAANPVDVDRYRNYSPVNWMGQETIGSTMIHSKNPLMRMIGQVGTENATGRGGRRPTVALTQSIRERLYMQDLREVEAYYRIYEREAGSGPIQGMLDGGMARRQFGRAISEELISRGRDNYVPAAEHIRKAADVYSRGYHRMAIDQGVAGTVGSARITPDVSYFPWRLSSAKVVSLTNSQRNAFIGAISEQVQARYGWDKEFSDNTFAPKYLERGLDRASGAYDVPINLNAPDAGDLIEDILEGLLQDAKGPARTQIEAMAGKFSRGGAGHTKARTDFDMLKQYTDDDGSTFSLLDIMEDDHTLLYRSYARRTAGEVALAQAGIPGAKGLKLLRKAMQVGGKDGERVTAQELAAFDQFAAEVLNQPFGKHMGKALDNIRLMTSMARLGGMAITQMVESGNGIATLGAHRVLSSIRDLPKMIKQVEDMRTGKDVKDSILGSLEQGYGGQIGMDDFNTIGAFDVPGNDIQLYGKETIGIGTKLVRGGANVHALASGHRHLAAAQTRGMAREIGMKAFRYIREGKEDKALADMGFSPELTAAIKKNLPAIAKFNSRGTLTELDIHAGDLTPAQRRDIIGAVNRGAHQIIQRTYIGETGPWAHDGFLKLLFQFRTFSLTAAEKQFGRQLHSMGVGMAFWSMMAGFSFGVPIYLARTALQAVGLSDQERQEFLDRKLTPEQIGIAGMQYASTFGLAADMIDVSGGVVSSLGVNTGLLPEDGGGRYGQYGSGRLLGGTIAPSAGLAEDLWKGAHGDWRKLGKSLPGANVPYMVPLINALESELEED